jgi:DNA-binding PadR family transcriptional regulator
MRNAYPGSGVARRGSLHATLRVYRSSDQYGQLTNRSVRVKNDDVRQHLPLNPRELVILASLIDGPLHGYGIIKAVEERSESEVVLDPANLYRLLRRVRAVGWIEEAATDDERRKAYSLTPTGRRLVAAELQRLGRLLDRALPSLAEGGAV